MVHYRYNKRFVSWTSSPGEKLLVHLGSVPFRFPPLFFVLDRLFFFLHNPFFFSRLFLSSSSVQPCGVVIWDLWSGGAVPFCYLYRTKNIIIQDSFARSSSPIIFLRRDYLGFGIWDLRRASSFQISIFLIFRFVGKKKKGSRFSEILEI